MPKSVNSVRGNSTRQPPEPSGSHAEIEAWTAKVMPDLNPVVKRIDELIRNEHSDLQYGVKWKKAYYGLAQRGWIIELVAYDVSVNVVFLGGADFASPPPLGDTDRTRYVKVKSVEDADTPEMKKWIEQAGKVAGWQ